MFGNCPDVAFILDLFWGLAFSSLSHSLTHSPSLSIYLLFIYLAWKRDGSSLDAPAQMG